MNNPTIDPAAFAHRANPNGTIDSICLTCFMTIATKPTEAELAHDEEHHDCKELAMENVAASCGSPSSFIDC